MLLLLVRHGLTPITGTRLTGWTPGIHLSDEGRKQAEAAAERLAGLPFKAVYSSPLERCVETAGVIAGMKGLQIETLDEIGEINYGDWQGKTFKSLYRSKGWGELNSNRADFRFPGGETPREAQTRAVAAVERLRKQHSSDMIVLVSHADLIRLVIAAYIGIALELYSRLAVDAASVSALLIKPPVPRLLALNHTGSYEELAGRFQASRTSPRGITRVPKSKVAKPGTKAAPRKPAPRAK